MIGKLTIDKASMNLSYFLYSLIIVSQAGGKCSREDFVQKMSDFLGKEAKKDGKELRTAYNKSKLPRYFGFLDVTKNSDVILTNRGKSLLPYILDGGNDTSPENRYQINPKNRSDFINLIFGSVIFDSFGRNNCGAEQSKTDIEAPKIIFKTLLELEKATSEEIHFIIFGLNRGYFLTFDDAIQEVKKNRLNKYDYKNILQEWNVLNIANDCKLIKIFTDENIQLIQKDKDENVNKYFYSLTPLLDGIHKEQITKLDIIYKPLQIFIYSSDEHSTKLDIWINETILGKLSDTKHVYTYSNHLNELTGQRKGSEFVPGILEQAVLDAFQNPDKSIYLLAKDITEDGLYILLKQYITLFDRKVDILGDQNGYSLKGIYEEDFYNYLVKNSTEAKKRLIKNEVVLPFNFNFIGSMQMSNKNINFDYKFQRCFTDLDGNQSSNNKKSVNIENNPKQETEHNNCLTITREKRTNAIYPLNFIIYGAPGTGKTYVTAEYALGIIENQKISTKNKTPQERKELMERYNKYIKDGQIVFTTFHQNYSYEDFIQGLRPDPKSSEMSFKVVDGIFKDLTDRALEDQKNNYVMIIDEINRANISKVFGELITLIEEDKRWGEANQLPAMLSSGDVFAVPNNLYIIGTMNSADKSISLIDTALRRRFEFIEKKPDASLVQNSTLRDVLEKLNLKLISELDSTDLLIGHSYFLNKKETDLANILNNSIIPLLYEYFYDNRKKVYNVLSEIIKDTPVEINDTDKVGRISVIDKS